MNTRGAYQPAVAAVPSSWPSPPEDMTVTAFEEINSCPRRWALSTAHYPGLWQGRGYPPKLQVHAVKGSTVHMAVETITKNLILAGCPSVQDPSATNVLKELGGYTKIITDCIQRVLRRFSDNPRALRILDSAERKLRGQTSDLRMRVQSILARLKLPPLAGAHERSRLTTDKTRRPLAIGAYPEVELRAQRIRWKGKADLLVLTAERCEITDFKTGVPDETHGFQVQVYALLWSLDEELNPSRRFVSRLILAYSTGDIEVETLSENQLRAFEIDLLERRKIAEAALVTEPPTARPTVENCRYCGVRHLCDVYWLHKKSAGDPEPGLDVRFSDVQLRIVSRHGPFSFDAILETTAGIALDRPALLRVQDSLDLQSGSRLRILDAGIAIDPDSPAQPVIVTLTMFSEIFAVA